MPIRTTIRTARRGWIPVLVFLAALAPASVLAQAQNEVPPEGEGPRVRHPEATEAIGQLWSPYCPGLMLEVCPSGGGAALRDSLQQMAEAGAESEELVQWVLSNHGEEYLALPARSGRGLLAWLGPPLATAVGIGIVVMVLLRMRARHAAHGPDTVPAEPSEEEEQKLQEALRQIDEEEEAPLF